jgi:hypothetical protein
MRGIFPCISHDLCGLTALRLSRLPCSPDIHSADSMCGKGFPSSSSQECYRSLAWAKYPQLSLMKKSSLSRPLLLRGCCTAPGRNLRKGSGFGVERGPLAGLEGTVVRVQAAFQLILALPLIQRSVFVRIDQESIEVRPELLFEDAPTPNGRNEPYHGHA